MFEYCIQICSRKFVLTRGFGSLQYDTWDNKTLKPAHTDHISKSLSFWNFVFVFLFVFVFVFAEVHHGRRGGAYCRKAPATWLLLTSGYFHSGAIVHSRPTPSWDTTTLLFLNSQGQFHITKHYSYMHWYHIQHCTLKNNGHSRKRSFFHFCFATLLVVVNIICSLHADESCEENATTQSGLALLISVRKWGLNEDTEWALMFISAIAIPASQANLVT